MANHFPLQGSGSGIYTYNVSYELSRKGHEVMVIAPDNEPKDDKNFKMNTIVFNNGENSEISECDFNFPCFTTHPQSHTTFYELSEEQIEEYIGLWRKHITQMIEEFQPDIIHAHHVWITPYVSASFPLPYVVTCHGTDLIGIGKDERYKDYALVGAHRAHGIIAISKQVENDAISAYSVKPERCHLIGNGFGEENFKIIEGLTKKDILAECNIASEETPVVAFVGKFTDLKGIDVLLKAAQIYEKEIEGVRTVLVGHGELWDEMNELAKELNLKGVSFVGGKTQKEVAEVFNVADLAVVPSRIEGFGLVAIEAMACGTPVVATKVGGLPEFVSEEVGSLVDKNDVEAFAAAVVKELSSQSKKSKGIAANKFAFENYTWSKQVDKMVTLYQEAIEQF